MEPKPFTCDGEAFQDVVRDLGIVADLPSSGLVQGIHHLDVRVFGLLREQETADLEVPRVASLDEMYKVCPCWLVPPVTWECSSLLPEPPVGREPFGPQLLVVVMLQFLSKFPACGQPREGTADQRTDETSEESDPQLHWILTMSVTCCKESLGKRSSCHAL